MIKTRQVDYQDLDKIAFHYKNVFGREITIDQYIKTFLDEQRFHSQIALNESMDIIGHIGISPHPIKGLKEKKVGFRFSTFIDNKYRGKGVYQTLMNSTLDYLKASNISVLYAWPNKINLVSCLKDNKFNPLFPQTTFEYLININSNKNIVNPDQYNINILNNSNLQTNELIDLSLLYSNLYESIVDYDAIALQKRLTRNNKVTYCIIKKHSKIIAFLGLQEDKDDNIYCAIHLNLIDFFQLKEILIDIVNSRWINKKQIKCQMWLSKNNREGIRNAIKSGMIENGPIFYRGFYVTNKFNKLDFPEEFISKTSMLNHDAF
tara:strand:- start:22428 stop:23387 length:960 start_codon:yes stop_codon:yes gene_type:complete